MKILGILSGDVAINKNKINTRVSVKKKSEVVKNPKKNVLPKLN